MLKDYVEMQWLMLQQERPEDYVIATGRQESVRTFIELSAEKLGWGGIVCEGKGLEEKGIRKDNNKIVVKVDSRYFRPTEVNSLLGNSKKAREDLGWTPKISLEELVEEMIKHDYQVSKREYFLKEKGYSINDFSNNFRDT